MKNLQWCVGLVYSVREGGEDGMCKFLSDALVEGLLLDQVVIRTVEPGTLILVKDPQVWPLSAMQNSTPVGLGTRITILMPLDLSATPQLVAFRIAYFHNMRIRS